MFAVCKPKQLVAGADSVKVDLHSPFSCEDSSL